ncbi:hypothetical protein BJY16_000558 [Actinoplanes octamycinicus]|uniref:Uncharacterized protein n=1 Tax=Actinoplanes octamycinicus TaxID=135948 RepID=A0A7W7GRT0_9ACTN|nr:hypothetical protein [Actinoplanes octamycinicus]
MWKTPGDRLSHHRSADSAVSAGQAADGTRDAGRSWRMWHRAGPTGWISGMTDEPVRLWNFVWRRRPGHRAVVHGDAHRDQRKEPASPDDFHPPTHPFQTNVMRPGGPGVSGRPGIRKDGEGWVHGKGRAEMRAPGHVEGPTGMSARKRAGRMGGGNERAGTGARERTRGNGCAGTGARERTRGNGCAGTGARERVRGNERAGTGARERARGNGRAGTGARERARGNGRAGTGARERVRGNGCAGTGARERVMPASPRRAGITGEWVGQRAGAVVARDGLAPAALTAWTVKR